jgi:hypothetical protein
MRQRLYSPRSGSTKYSTVQVSLSAYSTVRVCNVQLRCCGIVVLWYCGLWCPITKKYKYISTCTCTVLYYLVLYCTSNLTIPKYCMYLGRRSKHHRHHYPTPSRQSHPLCFSFSFLSSHSTCGPFAVCKGSLQAATNRIPTSYCTVSVLYPSYF